MRSAFLILTTLALLGVGFAIYFWMQPPSGVRNGQSANLGATPTSPRPTTNGSGIGPGQRAWMVQTDKTGKPTVRFRAAEHIPQSDQTIRVIKPEAEFYLDGGKILRMIGDHGVVSLPQDGPKKRSGGLAMPQGGAPNRGDMKDVTIRLFDTEQSTVPTMTLTLDNVSFDTELYRIFTDAAEIDGKHVERDQIPVKVRGDDYDFDGRGLVISLNEHDHRLELLEVEHGEKLIVKNPQILEKTKQPAASTPADTASLPPAPSSGGSGSLPTSSDVPVSPVAPTAPAPTASAQPEPSTAEVHSKPPAVYRASFLKDVRVTQGGAEVAVGEEMQLEFTAKSGATKTPTSAPSPPSASTLPSTPSSPSPEPPAQVPTVATPATSPSIPTSAPAQPIVIYWTDKLTVVPISEINMTAGNKLVRMIGSPVIVRQRGGEMRGRKLSYDTAQGHLIVEGSQDFPMEMTDGQGGKATADSLDFYRNQHLAEFHGRGSFTGTGRTHATTQSVMQANWTQLCRLHFVGDNEDSMALDRAEFTGDARLDDPTAKLAAQSLTMDFDQIAKPASKSKSKSPSTSKSSPTSTPRHLLAIGDVHGRVLSTNGKTQLIDSQRLEIFTERSGGGIYAQRLIADGKVVASDDKESLSGEHLAATMAPVAGAPAAAKEDQMLRTEVSELVADGAVNIVSKDGSSASAEHLHLQGEGDQQSITLTGSPARVLNKGNIITGPAITVHPDLQLYQVDGAGSMHIEQKDSKKATTRPADITWEKSFKLDGKPTANVADLIGNVKVNSLLSDGTQYNTSSQQVRLHLIDKPSPTTKRAPTTQTGIAVMGSKLDQLKDKSLSEAIFFDPDQKTKAHLQSLKPDTEGNLAQQFDLYSAIIQYDAVAEKLTVPTKGSIAFVDRKSKQTHGVTLVTWTNQLVYDKPKGQADIDGDVYIKQQPDDPKRQPFDMTAQHVTLNTATVKTEAGREVGFSKMIATGNVECTIKNTKLNAPRLEYDPAADTVTAIGTADDPVRVTDENAISKGSFGRFFYNRKTDEIKTQDVQVQSAR